MKRILVSILFLAAFSQVKAQAFGYSEPVKNAEGSNYQFTKVAHLDATPVQSQGQTGTCWSFSALSFFESELIRKGNKNPEILSEMFIPDLRPDPGPGLKIKIVETSPCSCSECKNLLRLKGKFPDAWWCSPAPPHHLPHLHHTEI